MTKYTSFFTLDEAFEFIREQVELCEQVEFYYKSGKIYVFYKPLNN